MALRRSWEAKYIQTVEGSVEVRGNDLISGESSTITYQLIGQKKFFFSFFLAFKKEKKIFFFDRNFGAIPHTGK